MATDKKLNSLVINTLTQAQYDSATKNEDELYLTPDDTDEQLANKQDKLVSGTNIKTVNGNSLLGSGNIEISGGDTSSYGMHTLRLKVMTDSVVHETLNIVLNSVQLQQMQNALMERFSVSTWEECKNNIETIWSGMDASSRVSQLIVPFSSLATDLSAPLFYQNNIDGNLFPCVVLNTVFSYVIYCMCPESYTFSSATGILWLNVTTLLAEYSSATITIDD